MDSPNTKKGGERRSSVRGVGGERGGWGLRARFESRARVRTGKCRTGLKRELAERSQIGCLSANDICRL